MLYIYTYCESVNDEGVIMQTYQSFPCYPHALLTDEKVLLMNNHEFGCYWKLLCYAWLEGSIPAQISAIADLLKEPLPVMKKLWKNIRPCFVISPKNSKRFINPKLELIRESKENFKKNRQSAGSKGAKSRWNKDLVDGSAIAQPYYSANDLPLANDSIVFVSEFDMTKRKKNINKKEKLKGQIVELPDWISTDLWS
jgi:hypothetical protein